MIRRRLAGLKNILGKRDEAFADLQQVVDQDPLDLAAQRSLGRALGSRGQFEKALAVMDRLEEVDPGLPILHWDRAMLYWRQGDHERALAEFDQEAYEFLRLTGKAIAYHHLGQREQAVTSLQSLISTMGESSSYQIAEVYAQWGDADNAMSWLERGYNIRDPGLQYLRNDEFFDPIREDPRLQAFLRKMNFGGLAPE
jgi:tetratricopeptide (TPR) repeat protein